MRRSAPFWRESNIQTLDPDHLVQTKHFKKSLAWILSCPRESVLSTMFAASKKKKLCWKILFVGLFRFKGKVQWEPMLQTFITRNCLWVGLLTHWGYAVWSSISMVGSVRWVIHKLIFFILSSVFSLLRLGF